MPSTLEETGIVACRPGPDGDGTVYALRLQAVCVEGILRGVARSVFYNRGPRAAKVLEWAKLELVQELFRKDFKVVVAAKTWYKKQQWKKDAIRNFAGVKDDLNIVRAPENNFRQLKEAGQFSNSVAPQ